jgi:lipopolysaccharide transport system permease protein
MSATLRNAAPPAATLADPGVPGPPGSEAVLDLSPVVTAGGRRRLALQDIRDGLRLWRLSVILGWLDIKLRYRGSTLGPFWLTLSTAVMVAAMGVLYAALFHMDLRQYLPFLAASQVLWAFLASLATEGCTAFLQSEAMIRATRMPFFVHAQRVVVRNLLVLAHNLVVIVVVFLIFGIWPGLRGLLAVPGFALWIVDGLALSLLLGTFCARFRDIPPIVASIMQIAFFVSAVIWKPEQLGPRMDLLVLNPFFTLLDVVRAPLLGEALRPLVWASALGYSAVLCGVTALLFSRVRGRLAFWV